MSSTSHAAATVKDLVAAVDAGDLSLAAALGSRLAVTHPSDQSIDELRRLTDRTWAALEGGWPDCAALRRLHVRAGRRLLDANVFDSMAAVPPGLRRGIELDDPRAVTDLIPRYGVELPWPADVRSAIEMVAGAAERGLRAGGADIEVGLTRLSSLPPSYEYNRPNVIADFVLMVAARSPPALEAVTEWYGADFFPRQRLGRRRTDWPSRATRLETSVGVVGHGTVKGVDVECLVTPQGHGRCHVRWLRGPESLSAAGGMPIVVNRDRAILVGRGALLGVLGVTS